MSKPILYITYANHSKDHLKWLTHEYEKVNQYLEAGDRKQHYTLRMEPFVNREKLHSDLVKYRQDLQLFSFSGHAGRDVLLLEDGQANADGIALALQQCTQLKLVMLNGCSTGGQVQQLLEMGIPVVIATSAAIEDDKAAIFAIRFFQALVTQTNIGMAYNFALAEIKSLDKNIVHHRRLFSSKKTDPKAPIWGIFCKEENKEALQFKLSHSAVSLSIPKNYKTNVALTEELWKALIPHSKIIKRRQRFAEEDEEEVDFGDKQTAILNSLPRPIAEHLRKLMCPVEEETKGYDKISLARLQQMMVCYETLMEFLTYLLLCQLWDLLNEEDFKISDKLSGQIHDFMQLPPNERQCYNFKNLILNILEIYEGRTHEFFIPQFRDLKDLLNTQNPFQDAYFFLHILQSQLKQEELLENSLEIPQLCQQGEESLIVLVGKLGYLAEYTLAAVKNIDVLRYRHLKQPQFKHYLVKLMRVFGKLQEEELDMNRFLYNRSVLLLKKDEQDKKNFQELNLSPFIMDENAFDLKTDLSKLYFFYRYKPNTDVYEYKHVNRPSERMLQVSDEQYDLMKKQFEMFRKEVLNKNL